MKNAEYSSGPLQSKEFYLKLHKKKNYVRTVGHVINNPKFKRIFNITSSWDLISELFADVTHQQQKSREMEIYTPIKPCENEYRRFCANSHCS